MTIINPLKKMTKLRVRNGDPSWSHGFVPVAFANYLFDCLLALGFTPYQRYFSYLTATVQIHVSWTILTGT